MPFAALIMVSLTAALTLVPTYCDWICPFKAVTEFEKVTSVESAAKAGVFISLFAGLVVVLPVMTKKKNTMQFSMSAGSCQYSFKQITPFTVKVDKERCNECFKCVEVCPLFAITKEGYKRRQCLQFSAASAANVSMPVQRMRYSLWNKGSSCRYNEEFPQESLSVRIIPFYVCFFCRINY